MFISQRKRVSALLEYEFRNHKLGRLISSCPSRYINYSDIDSLSLMKCDHFLSLISLSFSTSDLIDHKNWPPHLIKPFANTSKKSNAIFCTGHQDVRTQLSFICYNYTKTAVDQYFFCYNSSGHSCCRLSGYQVIFRCLAETQGIQPTAKPS